MNGSSNVHMSTTCLGHNTLITDLTLSSVQIIFLVSGHFDQSNDLFDYQVIWLYHLIINDSAMWKHLQNVYSQIKQTRLKPLSQPIWQPPPLHHVSYQRPTHRRLLAFPVCAFIIGEDSFVITSRQFGIHACLQCAFQRLLLISQAVLCCWYRMPNATVETCISFMGFDLVRMVRSVETKRMRGTEEKILWPEKFKYEFLVNTL
jgi:hypothetical protein